MLFAVESVGAVDAAGFQRVLDLADTLVMIKARMIDKAAETIVERRFHGMPQTRFGQCCPEDAIPAKSWL